MENRLTNSVFVIGLIIWKKQNTLHIYYDMLNKLWIKNLKEEKSKSQKKLNIILLLRGPFSSLKPNKYAIESQFTNFTMLKEKEKKNFYINKIQKANG